MSSDRRWRGTSHSTTSSAGGRKKTTTPGRAEGLVCVDSCVLLAVLLPRSGSVPPDERLASRALVRALDEGRLRSVTSAMALAEITYVAGREGLPSVECRRFISLLTGLTFSDVTPELAAAAAEFRLLHYHRERAPISYADALFAVTAWDSGADHLVTFDAPLLALGDSRIVPPSALGL